jgi:hypothetical protein
MEPSGVLVESGMNKSRYTEEQLVGILKESETGMATRIAPEA